MAFKQIVSAIIFGSLLATLVCAQDPAPLLKDKADQEQKKRKLLEAKAVELLEGLIGQVAALKLPENRVRAEVDIGRMLWKKQPDRAKILLQDAITDLAGM